MSENPKHYAGAKKVPFGDVPAIVEAELSLAMHEGARKYGAYNYRRDPIRASDYYDAASRHLKQWYELGEDVDPTCGISHVTKAIAALTVLRDAQINGMVKDDRPPAANREHWAQLEKVVNDLREKYPEPAKRITSWEGQTNDPPNGYKFFEPLATLNTKEERYAKILKDWNGEGTKLSAVETGEYFEPPVKGYTR